MSADVSERLCHFHNSITLYLAMFYEQRPTQYCHSYQKSYTTAKCISSNTVITFIRSTYTNISSTSKTSNRLEKYVHKTADKQLSAEKTKQKQTFVLPPCRFLQQHVFFVRKRDRNKQTAHVRGKKKKTAPPSGN